MHGYLPSKQTNLIIRYHFVLTLYPFLLIPSLPPWICCLDAPMENLSSPIAVTLICCLDAMEAGGLSLNATGGALLASKLSFRPSGRPRCVPPQHRCCCQATANPLRSSAPMMKKTDWMNWLRRSRTDANKPVLAFICRLLWVGVTRPCTGPDINQANIKVSSKTCKEQLEAPKRIMQDSSIRLDLRFFFVGGDVENAKGDSPLLFILDDTPHVAAGILCCIYEEFI